MIDNHLITPPQWLVDAWCKKALAMGADVDAVFLEAVRWGADQELEACCEALARELICDGKHVATDLRSVRRPKPPSLAEEALKALKRQAVRSVPSLIATEDCDTIRCALERLQELENND